MLLPSLEDCRIYFRTIIEDVKHFFVKLDRAKAYFVHGFKSPDWDSHYLLTDIRFKIDRMHKDLLSFKYLDKDEKSKLDLMYIIILNLIDIELKQSYIQEVHELVETFDVDKFGEPDKNGYVEWKLHRTFVKGVTEKDYERALKRARKKQNKNLKKIFKTLETEFSKMWI